jgi:hypothetical protein
MTKHTPGPWIIDAEENFIHATDPRHTIVCGFYATLRNPEVMADARLIAAAPELLSELRHLVLLLEPLEKGGTLNVPGLATLNGARVAIAKAEGTT